MLSSNKIRLSADSFVLFSDARLGTTIRSPYKSEISSFSFICSCYYVRFSAQLFEDASRVRAHNVKAECPSGCLTSHWTPDCSNSVLPEPALLSNCAWRHWHSEVTGQKDWIECEVAVALWTVRYEGCGKKPLWSTLKNHPVLEWRDCGIQVVSDRDSNMKPPAYEARALTIRPRAPFTFYSELFNLKNENAPVITSCVWGRGGMNITRVCGGGWISRFLSQELGGNGWSASRCGRLYFQCPYSRGDVEKIPTLVRGIEIRSCHI
jgi:hypothetical protein